LRDRPCGSDPFAHAQRAARILKTIGITALEVLDPDGAIVVSSGNTVNESEGALFVPKKAGRYVLSLKPFAAVGAQYEARVKIAK
jgi:hypothetical protein